MKRIVIVLVFVLGSVALINAQNSDYIEQATEAPIISYVVEDSPTENITIKEASGYLFITLMSNDELEDGFYTFERSSDKENYQILSTKYFQANPSNQKIMYSFRDELAETKTSYKVYKFVSGRVACIAEHDYVPQKNMASND